MLYFFNVSIRAPHFHAGRRQEPRREAEGRGSFNPRPALSCGATLYLGVTPTLFEVSIRAPHFHAGRLKRGNPRCRGILFQSAPRTFMRGDWNPVFSWKYQTSFNPRPALSCGATGRSHEQRIAGLVSIRAPHFHAGRRSPLSSLPLQEQSFNPRPALSCGATFLFEYFPDRFDVSIRAPHFHAGRPGMRIRTTRG